MPSAPPVSPAPPAPPIPRARQERSAPTPASAPGGRRTGPAGGPADAEVRILGTPTVDAPGPVDPERIETLTELVVFLAAHRDGVHPGLVQAAIWPRGVPEDVVVATLRHAQAWLGPAPSGQPRITVGPDGRWRLSPDVRCDWELFVAYALRARQPTSDTEIDLTTALQMVSGPLWSNLPEGRYGWLATSPVEASTRKAVVDVAHQLAELTLRLGDTTTAIAACRTGLRAVPTAEALWRDLLRTVATRGDRRTLEAVAVEMYRNITIMSASASAPARSGRQAEPETDALVQELLPGFRRRH